MEQLLRPRATTERLLRDIYTALRRNGLHIYIFEYMSCVWSLREGPRSDAGLAAGLAVLAGGETKRLREALGGSVNCGTGSVSQLDVQKVKSGRDAPVRSHSPWSRREASCLRFELRSPPFLVNSEIGRASCLTDWWTTGASSTFSCTGTVVCGSEGGQIAAAWWRRFTHVNAVVLVGVALDLGLDDVVDLRNKEQASGTERKT